MSNPTSPAAQSPTVATATSSNEDDLRRQLRAAMQRLNRREPLEPTYKRLLSSGSWTRPRELPKHPFYKRIHSKLRERVEIYSQEMQGKDPFDRISQRQKLEEDAMRAAFTLREAKDHEQVPLLEATLASSSQAMNQERKRHLDGIAKGLQAREEKKRRIHTPAAAGSSKMEQTEQARKRAELEAQRAQARKWEEARGRREEEERRREEEEAARSKKAETPQQALHRIIEPVFRKLWDMEFANLGGTNPFRIVIDRDNCSSIGAPDYFDVISKPMNLTYVQEKVQKMQYSTLQEFFSDVDLMISNAIKYNSDPGNSYRVAAEEMKKRHTKIVNKVWQQIRRQKAQS